MKKTNIKLDTNLHSSFEEKLALLKGMDKNKQSTLDFYKNQAWIGAENIKDIDTRIIPLFNTPIVLKKIELDKSNTKNSISSGLKGKTNQSLQIGLFNSNMSYNDKIIKFTKKINKYNLELNKSLVYKNNLEFILFLRNDDYLKIKIQLYRIIYMIKKFIHPVRAKFNKGIEILPKGMDKINGLSSFGPYEIINKDKISAPSFHSINKSNNKLNKFNKVNKFNKFNKFNKSNISNKNNNLLSTLGFYNNHLNPSDQDHQTNLFIPKRKLKPINYLFYKNLLFLAKFRNNKFFKPYLRPRTGGRKLNISYLSETAGKDNKNINAKYDNAFLILMKLLEKNKLINENVKDNFSTVKTNNNLSLNSLNSLNLVRFQREGEKSKLTKSLKLLKALKSLKSLESLSLLKSNLIAHQFINSKFKSYNKLDNLILKNNNIEIKYLLLNLKNMLQEIKVLNYKQQLLIKNIKNKEIFDLIFKEFYAYEDYLKKIKELKIRKFSLFKLYNEISNFNKNLIKNTNSELSLHTQIIPSTYFTESFDTEIKPIKSYAPHCLIQGKENNDNNIDSKMINFYWYMPNFFNLILLKYLENSIPARREGDQHNNIDIINSEFEDTKLMSLPPFAPFGTGAEDKVNDNYLFKLLPFAQYVNNESYVLTSFLNKNNTNLNSLTVLSNNTVLPNKENKIKMEETMKSILNDYTIEEGKNRLESLLNSKNIHSSPKGGPSIKEISGLNFNLADKFSDQIETDKMKTNISFDWKKNTILPNSSSLTSKFSNDNSNQNLNMEGNIQNSNDEVIPYGLGHSPVQLLFYNSNNNSLGSEQIDGNLIKSKGLKIKDKVNSFGHKIKSLPISNSNLTISTYPISSTVEYTGEEKKSILIKKVKNSINNNNFWAQKNINIIKDNLVNKSKFNLTDGNSLSSSPQITIYKETNKPQPIISHYLKSMSIYNLNIKGTFVYFSNIIGFNFNNDKNYKNVYKFIQASFKAIFCLISKPVFVVKTDKIIIQLFYFLMIPKLLKSYKKRNYKFNLKWFNKNIRKFQNRNLLFYNKKYEKNTWGPNKVKFLSSFVNFKSPNSNPSLQDGPINSTNSTNSTMTTLQNRIEGENINLLNNINNNNNLTLKDKEIEVNRNEINNIDSISSNKIKLRRKRKEVLRNLNIRKRLNFLYKDGFVHSLSPNHKKWYFNEANILSIQNLIAMKKKKNLSLNQFNKKKNQLQKRYNIYAIRRRMINKFKDIKINKKIKLIKLSKVSLINLYPEKFNIICNVLSKFFNKNIELDLIRVHYPYNESNILVNLFAIMINKIKFRRITRKLFRKIVIKNINKIFRNRSNNSNFNVIPAFLTGMKIKLGGRLMNVSIKSRKTVTVIERGASSPGKVNYTDLARYTNKNKRGAYSITISSGQNYF